ncbi:hypothetical protein I4U23_019898 [Adineta vaga]|nr:hypothetical protein I4U23_019898 [Adineta vaga]
MFRSQKRLKKNPSSIYLLAASIGNLVLLNTSFLSRIILPGFNFDPSSTILVWCKLRQYFGQIAALTSLFCVVWAIIDQYLLTSNRAYLRHLSSIKIARCLVFLTFSVWFLHALPLTVFNQINISKPNNITSCSLSSNTNYEQYAAYVVTPFLLGILPSILMILFSISTFLNINYLHQQQMRTHIQKQITRMITAQTMFILIGTTAYTTQIIYTLLTKSTSKTLLRQAQENLGLTIASLLSYTGYSFNFYIYMFVSSSFRKQFKQLITKYAHCFTRLNHIGNNSRPPTHVLNSR